MLRRYSPGLIVLLRAPARVVVEADLPRARHVLLHEPDRVVPADRDLGDLVRIRRFRRPEPDDVLSKRDVDLLTGENGVRARLRLQVTACPPSTSGSLVGLAFFAFVLGAAFKGPLTNRAIYRHTNYASISGLPEGGVARLMPQEVAVQIASSGFNSPTEKLTDFRSVSTPEASPGPRSALPMAPSGSSRRRVRGSSP